MSDNYRFGAVIACLAATGEMALADDRERGLSAGALVTVSVANGEPANDIPGFGVQFRYALSDRWALGATLLQSEYDFETPAQIVGITQSSAIEPVDALAQSTLLQAWAERMFHSGGGATTWFLGAGLGAASVDVPDVSGAREDGGQFDVHTEVDTEIILTAFAGVRRSFGDRWYGEFRLHANQHFADWRVQDRISGNAGAIDDYASFGGQVAIGIRW